MSETEGKVVELGPRFRLVPFDRITVGSELVYLVKGIIPAAGLVVVWGPPKCGKSFWTFDLVMHVALGWKYRGRRVQQGPVVYLALEGGEGFRARVEAFRQSFLPEVPDTVPFYLIADALNLVKDHPDLIRCIRLQAAGSMPAVVVIDTLNRSLAGSESDDKDMAAYIRAADAIRAELGCVVIVVHHCGIDATRPRGHTSLAGAVDAQLAVKRDTADNIVVTVERMKDGPEGDQIVSRLEVVDVGTDADGDTISSCSVKPAEASAPQTATRKVTGAKKVALDILRKAIDEAPSSPPASNHIPPNTGTCLVETWRAYAYQASISESDKQDTRKRAFARAAEKLQAANLIGIWGDYVWII
jgi:AAA domain